MHPKSLPKAIAIAISLLFLIYVALPSQGYPLPYPGAKQSREPADLETPLRQGYYIDGASRQEIISHYQKQFSNSKILSLPLPSLRLNYPPEEAQTIIRDQTKSTFLEEIVNPFRESIYINGFEPTKENQFIYIDGKKWDKKIIVRYVQAPLAIRFALVLLTTALAWIITKQWILQLKKDLKIVK